MAGPGPVLFLLTILLPVDTLSLTNLKILYKFSLPWMVQELIFCWRKMGSKGGQNNAVILA